MLKEVGSWPPADESRAEKEKRLRVAVGVRKRIHIYVDVKEELRQAFFGDRLPYYGANGNLLL